MSAKGGDIDLLLVFKDEQSKLVCQKNKHKILAAIKKNIGDQKVDLLLACETDLKTDPFLVLVFERVVAI